MPRKQEAPTNPLLQIAWVTKKRGCSRAVVVSFGSAVLILPFMRGLHPSAIWKAAKVLLGLLMNR